MRATVAIHLGERSIRAVLTEGERPLKVRRLLSFDRQADPAPQLRELLAEAPPKARVHLVLPSSGQDHLCSLLPPMPAAEARAVIEREVRRALNEEPLFAFAAGAVAEEQGARKTEYQVALAPRGAVEEHLRLLTGAGAAPEHFTTLPLALASALALHEAGSGEAAPSGHAAAVVWAGRGVSHLAIVCGGAVLLSRRISCESQWPPQAAAAEEEAAECPTGAEEALERLAAEINRTGLYFKQRFRGRDIDRLLVCGEEGFTPEQVAALSERLNLPAHLFDPQGAVEVAEGVPRAELPAFALALGAAALSGAAARLNLLPPDYLARRSLRFKRLAVYGLAAALALCAGAGWLGMRLALGRYRAVLAEQAPTLAAADAFLVEKARVERERQLCEWRRGSLKRLGFRPEPWLALLARLSTDTPRGARLEALKVAGGPPGGGLTLSGEVEAADAYEAAGRYGRLWAPLARSALFAGLREQSEIAPEAVTDAAGKECGRRSRLKFTITGSLQQP